ncbi:MAG: hypothetical protein HY015_05730, partial [Bacteroidetes bacterium]|nr:hypothetical protein [Bacteroidota bacterium]
LPRDLIANFSIENGAFDIISYSHDILPIPSPSFSSIAFIRRDGQTQLLHTYNKQAGITNYSKCFAGSDIRPLAWSSESELICLIGDLLSSQLEIFDLKGCKRKSLSISNFSFVGLSPDLKKMLVQQKDRIESISKLLLFDIDTNESKFLTKSFKLITSAGWLNSDEVYYSYGKKTYAVSINDQHERVLNNLSSPIVSSKGDRLVYYNRSNNGIYVAKIDGSNPVLILQLKKEKQ